MAAAESTTPPTVGIKFVFRIDDLDEIAAGLDALIESQPVEEAIGFLRRLQDRLSIAETKKLARRVSAGVSHRETERLASDRGARSRAEAKRRTKRAEAVAANPELAQSVELGRLSTGQLDAIADASARTDGAAATDVRLLESIEGLDAEQAHTAARNYVDRHRADALETEYQRQRRRRRVAKRCNADGMHQLTAEGDKASIDLLWQQLCATAEGLYQADGGRDLPRRQHPRTRDQRMFDALVDQLSAAIGTAKAKPARVVVTTTLENLLDGAPAPAELIGSGPLPRDLFARYLASAEIVGLLFGGDGHPLRLGRTVRDASQAQRLALWVRDRGCFRCGAHPIGCHAHHVVAHTAVSGGETNIDNLALACGDCHQQLHHDLHVLEWNAEHRRWQPRPGRPHELASPNRKPETVPGRSRPLGSTTHAGRRPGRRSRGPGLTSRAESPDDEPH